MSSRLTPSTEKSPSSPPSSDAPIMLIGDRQHEQPVRCTGGVGLEQAARPQWPYEFEGRVGRSASGRRGRRWQRRAVRGVAPTAASTAVPFGLSDGPWCCSSGNHGEWLARALTLLVRRRSGHRLLQALNDAHRGRCDDDGSDTHGLATKRTGDLVFVENTPVECRPGQLGWRWTD